MFFLSVREAVKGSSMYCVALGVEEEPLEGLRCRGLVGENEVAWHRELDMYAPAVFGIGILGGDGIPHGEGKGGGTAFAVGDGDGIAACCELADEGDGVSRIPAIGVGWISTCDGYADRALMGSVVVDEEGVEEFDRGQYFQVEHDDAIAAMGVGLGKNDFILTLVVEGVATGDGEVAMAYRIVDVEL